MAPASDLSPAAQAILKAAYKATQNPKWQTNFYASYAAAVLRAAADQVVPEEPEHAYAEDYELGVFDARLDARNHLLSIAAELEAQ
jgi:hypothetical protein